MKRSDGFSSNAASERDGFSEDQHVDIPRLHEEIRRLTELEEDEKKTGASKEEGWSAGENAAAYSTACKLFLELEKDHLNSQEIAALEKAYLNIKSLKDDNDRMMELAAKLSINFTTVSDLAKLFGRALPELAQDQYDRLNMDGELYLNYGFGGHYEAIRISSDNGTNYQVTIYNAGAEAESANKEQQRVKAITRYNNVHFDSAEDLKNFIIAVQKRQFIEREDPEFPIISKYIKDTLGEARAFDHNSSSQQIRGNCATRSIREALKDMLPDDLFKKLYGFVSNEEIINRSVTDFANKHLEQKIEPDYTIQNQISRNIPINPSDLKSSSAQYRFKQTSKPEGTLLHYALFKNNSGLVDKLMTLGMTGEEIDRAGDSALLYAVKHNKIGLFNQIIDSSKGNISDLLTQTNRYGQSVILTA